MSNMRKTLATLFGALSVVGALLFSAGSAWAVTGEYICTNIAAEDRKFGEIVRDNLALNALGETKFILNKNTVTEVYPFETPFESNSTYSGSWSTVDTGEPSLIARLFEVVDSDEGGPLLDIASVFWIHHLDERFVVIQTHRPVLGTQNHVRFYHYKCRNE